MKKGQFITKEEARDFVFAHSGDHVDDKKWVWGQVFDLNLVKEFIGNIDDHNRNNPDNLITDLRVYYAKSERDDKNTYEDVVIVGARGRVDIPEFLNEQNARNNQKADGGGGNLLGNGLPCPNICPET